MFIFYDDKFSQMEKNNLGKCITAHWVFKGALKGNKKATEEVVCVGGARLKTVTALPKWSHRKLRSLEAGVLPAR